MRNIDLIREVTTAAAGNWPYVLAGLSIDVPDSSRRHAPCQVVADSVISARTVRPGGKAGQRGQATDALRRAQQPSRDEYDQRPPFDDETPF